MTTNTQRAKWANSALDTFSTETGLEGEELDTQISDLLCNLQHLCTQENIEFTECLDRSTRNYETELELD